MEISFTSRLKHAWDAFQQREPPIDELGYYGSWGTSRPDRLQLSRGNERSMVTSIYNRIAVDVSMVKLEHVKKNDSGMFVKTIDSKLNNALTLDANIDQTGQAFLQDLVMSMFDEGCVAVVPIYTTLNPNLTQGYDVVSMRTAKILEWYPKHVRVEIYNEQKGIREAKLYQKSYVGIIENPFYAVMNEPNSTLQRLIRTLNTLDVYDKRTAGGKLDMIIKLPYATKLEQKHEQAIKRRQEIESQLSDSKLGIAYLSPNEDVIQLGRSLGNNLWDQANDLMDQLFAQLGMPKSIFEGTASDEEKTTYYNNTISPILSAISKELTRKFLSPTARTQGQSIDYYQDVFKLVPVTKVSEIVDKFTRNEVLSPNEVRMQLGYRPSDDPKANELRNRNLNEKGGSSNEMNVLDDVGIADELGIDEE